MPAMVIAGHACNPSAQEVKAGGSLGLLAVQCTVIGELQAVEDCVSKEVGSMSEQDTRGCPLACTYTSMHTHIHIHIHTHVEIHNSFKKKENTVILKILEVFVPSFFLFTLRDIYWHCMFLNITFFYTLQV